MKQQMNVEEWLQNNTWFIRIKNEEQFDLVQEWLEENYGYKLNLGYYDYFVALVNVDVGGDKAPGYPVLFASNEEGIYKGAHEIKFSFKTSIDNVEFPEVKSEQELKIEELETTIKLAQQQIEALKELK